MKRLRLYSVLACTALILTCLPGGVAAAGALSPDARFAQAAQAYDAQEYEQAVTLYEGLLRDGLRAPELYFNLANAYFRMNDPGSAIRHYKHAEYLAPRDADIRHNLHFAVLQADAAYAPPGAPARWLHMLSASEWSIVASLAWWLTALHLAFVLWPGTRRGWGVIATLTVLVLLLSLAGISHWALLDRNPEVVITQPAQEALFAPIDGSTAHFALPRGSIARIESVTEGWYKVRLGDKDGWIRQTAARRVAPWRPDLD